MSDCVIDASAVLAWLGAEPGADRVEAAVAGAALCAANAAEVVAKLIDRGKSPELAVMTLTLLPCVIAPVDAEVGLEAGRLREATRHGGLSLGDRLCLAFAKRHGLPALTADRAWLDAVPGVEVLLIR